MIDFDNLPFWNTLNKTYQGILVWNRNKGLHTKRKCKKRKENLDFLTLWARLVEEENEEHDLLGRTHVLSSSCSLGKKKLI